MSCSVFPPQSSLLLLIQEFAVTADSLYEAREADASEVPVPTGEASPASDTEDVHATEPVADIPAAEITFDGLRETILRESQRESGKTGLRLDLGLIL